MNKEAPVGETQYGYLWLNNYKKVSLDNPDGAVMDIQTIANALSHICRFAGQLNCFYSVAQHSVLVSHLVSTRWAFAGLMHDATEAFCNDLPKPIKQILPDYDVIEDKFWLALAKQYDLPIELPHEIHTADRIALITEARDLQNGNDWKTWLPDLQPLPFVITAQRPEEAFRSFMRRFNELTGVSQNTKPYRYDYAL